jgi:hypothetical protein
MASFAFPAQWQEFIERHGLDGASFEIPETVDVSGLGADLQLLTLAQAREEAEDCYAGLAVGADGYVPVGMCLLGSGDPYFIREGDGAGGPLYRIYHDAVAWDDADVPRYGADAVAIVLESCEALLHHARATHDLHGG